MDTLLKHNKEMEKRFDDDFTFEGNGDWIDVDKLDAHKLKDFINQEISDLKKSIREEIEKIENPYKVVVLDTDKSVAEWALLEHGKRMGYERMRDEILSLKSLE